MRQRGRVHLEGDARQSAERLAVSQHFLRHLVGFPDKHGTERPALRLETRTRHLAQAALIGDAGDGLREAGDGISQRMLTVTLRGLERDGLVVRSSFPEVPPRVEYSLTPLGATLRQHLRGLVAWAGAHLDEVDMARAAYDKRHGPPVRMSVAERQLAKRRVALRK